MAEDDEKTAGPRALRLRFAGTCRGCGVGLAKGSEAWWWAVDRSVECQACRTGTGALAPLEPSSPVDEAVADEQPLVGSTAGGSAQREYERRATRERSRQEAAVERDQQARVARREERPVLGRLVNALTERPPEPRETHAIRAWSVGAAGERRVAEVLDATNCFVLHDRRVPGTRANIDHLAVGPAGVFVIDAKKYEDKQLEVRDKGRLLSPDLRLYVGGRDNTKLVEGVERQCEVVRDALDDHEVVVRPVLCFVGATWPGCSRTNRSDWATSSSPGLATSRSGSPRTAPSAPSRSSSSADVSPRDSPRRDSGSPRLDIGGRHQPSPLTMRR